MAIQKHPYELSIWGEELIGEGQKREWKILIIGAHDMNYEGKATSIKLVRKINGTNELSFQMPDKFFDSKIGDYIQNDFAKEVFAERKLKLYYKDKWYEFYVKTVKENKNFKSFMKTYTCTDSFIDELARNGYGITFDEELYNNVEEIGTFSKEILEDSIWTYAPQYNWGDFTEYTEDKLFKIPTSQFNQLKCYKLDFTCASASSNDIINYNTKETRKMEMGDDLARVKEQYWDQQGENNPLKKTLVNLQGQYDYIYIPYSCLSFCYVNIHNGNNDIFNGIPNTEGFPIPDRAATETPVSHPNFNSYALAPNNVNPNTYIQFLAFGDRDKLEIDEAGLILNKDYHYFMTLEQWNSNLSTNYWYIFEDTRYVETKFESTENKVQINYTFKYLTNATSNGYVRSLGNKIAFYNGYLGELNDFGTIKGKKISIADRTEINISKEIDSFVTVYKEDPTKDITSSIKIKDLLIGSSNWSEPNVEELKKYRICSRQSTRQITPELARNFIQNGTNIQSTDGWDSMVVNYNGDVAPAQPEIRYWKKNTEITYQGNEVKIDKQLGSYLYANEATAKITMTISVARINDTYALDLFKQGYINRWSENTNGFLIYSQKMQVGSYLYYIKYSNGDGTSSVKGFFVPQVSTDVFNTEADAKNYIMANTSSSHILLRQVFDSLTEDSNNLLINQGHITKIDIDTFSSTIDIVVGEEKKSSTISLNESLINGLNSIVNFGIVGQEQIIEKGKIYCLGLDMVVKGKSTSYIEIGEGGLDYQNNYILHGETLKFEENQFLSNVSGRDTFNLYQIRSNDNFWTDIETNREFQVHGVYNVNTQKETTELLTLETYILFKSNITIENPYIVLKSNVPFLLKGLYLFEAYTKGADQFSNAYYKYSGRELLGNEQSSENESIPWEDKENYTCSSPWTPAQIKQRIIFDNDIMPGDSYSYNKYFVQQLKTKDGKKVEDTFGVKSYIENPNTNTSFILDCNKYTDDDYEIITNYIDLSKCPHYISNTSIETPDCSYCNDNTFCYYQKFGYCPYLFTSEKHPRRIRTLKGEKSNRFNLIQEVSKTFKCYPVFNIEHDEAGHINCDNNDIMQKNLYYITEKGVDRPLGFRYEKNLSNISRSIISDKIVSKLYVLDVDSEYSKTGLCSIKMAEDNPSKDSFIIDLSYYIAKGMLSQNTVEADLYGTKTNEGQGYLKQLGYYNTLYDNLSNKIINLQSASYNDLESHVNVNLEGITAAQGQLREYMIELVKYKDMTESSIYKSYVQKYCEQEAILVQLIISTFFNEEFYNEDIILSSMPAPYIPDSNEPFKINYIIRPTTSTSTDSNNYEVASAKAWLEQFEGQDLAYLFNYWKESHTYTHGLLGQYNKEYQQIQEWKKERAKYLKKIKELSNAFFKKYEPYLKEGTWSDSNYLTDNAYYNGALDVAAQGAIPKVEYTISVVDLAPIEGDEYLVDLADTTYVEDIGLLGANLKTGLPNHLKVLISELSEELDNPSKNSIKVQNFTTQFEDLFSQVTASIQSLNLNENIYRRAKNFNSLHNIESGSLQRTLDSNDITFVDKNKQNLVIDETGQSGSDINNRTNKYKLTGQGLYFSNDGGQSWSAGVSPGGGINKDYIKTDTLETDQLTIGNGKTIYSYVANDGLTAYTNSQGSSTDSTNIRYGGDKMAAYYEGSVDKLSLGFNTNGNIDFVSKYINNLNLTSNDGANGIKFSNSILNLLGSIKLQGYDLTINNSLKSGGPSESGGTWNQATQTFTYSSRAYHLIMFSLAKKSGSYGANSITVCYDGIFIGGTISYCNLNGFTNFASFEGSKKIELS